MASDLMVYEANGKEVELSKETVKNYLVNGNGKVTDQEVTMFMSLCKYQGLNPFLKECYLVKYSDKAPAQIVVGKEAYMKRAQAQENYKGFKAGIIVARDGEIKELEGAFKLPNDQLLGGWAEVYVDGASPTVAKVSIQEYGKSQSTWNDIPCTMIRKVAIVQALRETYPEQLGAMYVAEEVEGPVFVEETAKKGPVRAVKQSIDSDVIEVDVEEVDGDKEERKEALNNLFKLVEEKGIETDVVMTLMESNYGKAKSSDLTLEEIKDFTSVINLYSMGD